MDRQNFSLLGLLYSTIKHLSNSVQYDRCLLLAFGPSLSLGSGTGNKFGTLDVDDLEDSHSYIHGPRRINPLRLTDALHPLWASHL